MIGSTISHYKVLEKIGEGGMGVVYKGIDTRLYRPVAIKILSENLVNSEQSRLRFFHEARAVSFLNHPNICSVYEIETDGPTVFIVFEFIEGQSLRQVLQDKCAFSEIKVAQYGLQICAALTAAHGKSIIHRDIKPDNIMINGDGVLKVTDFGLAKLNSLDSTLFSQPKMGTGLKHELSSFATSVSTLQGTPMYMSPEQIRNEDIDERSDLYSLGVVFYELLTGHLPFVGADLTNTLQTTLNNKPTPTDNYRKNVSAQFQNILYKLLEKEKQDRYANSIELEKDLENICQPEKKDHQGRTIIIFNQKKRFRKITSTVLIVLFLAILLLGYFRPWTFIKNTFSDNLDLPVYNKPDSTFAIAVAPFWGTNEPEKAHGREFQTRIVVRLKELLNGEEIQIISDDTIQPIKSHDSARKAGLEGGADIVLWGIYRLMEGNVDIESYITLSDHKNLARYRYRDILVYDLSDDNGFRLYARNSEEIATKCLFMTAQHFYSFGYGKKSLSVNHKIIQRTYEVLVQEANILTYLNNTAAEEILQSAIQAQPEKVRAYSSLGYYYLSRGNYRKSINILNKAVLLDPNNTWSLNHLGNAHLYLGQYSEALDNFQKALYINPKHYNALSRISAVYYELGQYDKAIPVMERAMQFSTPKALKQLLYRLANIYLEKGDFDNAIKYFKQTIKVSPRESWVHHSLAMAYTYRYKYKKAVKELEIEISNYPSREVHYNGLGSIYLAQGNYEKATKSFSASLKLNSENFYSHLLYYIVLVKSEKRAAAQKHLDSLTIFTKSEKWIAPMLSFYAGNIDADSALAATKALKPIHEKRNRCEAYYYLGTAYLLDIRSNISPDSTNEQLAKKYFKRCLDTGIRDYWECVLAQAELNRLNGQMSITQRLTRFLRD